MNRKYSVIKKGVWLLLPCLWMVLIFYFSHQPAETSSELSGGLVAKLIEILHLPVTEHFVRKTAHFVEYTVLGILVANGVRVIFLKFRPWVAGFFCAFYSITDEVHQWFIPGRSCQLSDMLLDTAGAVTGVLLLWLLLLWAKRREFRRSPRREG